MTHRMVSMTRESLPPPLAHEGAALLSHDIHALKLTGDSHLTTIGHSYGSTVVADAAWTVGHTRFGGADNVVLIGSPGTDMARNANDFHLPAGGHVFVGAASTDPITQLGHLPTIPAPGTVATVGLGPDPAMDGYGSTRFTAEVPGLTFNDHGHYYDPGSDSLRSIGLISSGHSAFLERLGLTAPHREGLVERALDVLQDGLGLRDQELLRLPGN